MFRTARSDVTLRELERRIVEQQRRIEQLERIEQRSTSVSDTGYQWECDRCPLGWIVHDGDELRCTDCGYLRYL